MYHGLHGDLHGWALQAQGCIAVANDRRPAVVKSDRHDQTSRGGEQRGLAITMGHNSRECDITSIAPAIKRVGAVSKKSALFDLRERELVEAWARAESRRKREGSDILGLDRRVAAKPFVAPVGAN